MTFTALHRCIGSSRSAAGLRTLAACALLLHLQPVMTPLVSGAAHGYFHLVERLALVNAEWLSAQRASWLQAVPHTHGPDGEPHTHAAIVDIALAVAGVQTTSDRETARTPVEVRLDLHVVSEVQATTLLPPPPFDPEGLERSPRSILSKAPPPPPPKV